MDKQTRESAPDQDLSPVEREPLVFAGMCDLGGVVRGKGFPAADLPSRLRKGVGLAHSNIMISAFGPIYETPFGTEGDVILHPDISTEVYIEFQGTPPEHFFLGDLVTCEGKPWEYCPRDFLRRALADLETESALDFCSAFEQEFVLTGAEKRPGFPYALDSFRRQTDFGEKFLAAMRRAGITPDSFLAEAGDQQYEYTSAPVMGLKSADQAVITRELARAVAWRKGRRAIFAPMIEQDGAGNGTHVHFSLWDSEARPAIYDSSEPLDLSKVGASFVAGIIHHLPTLTAITAPSVCSYYRLTPNRWAPTWANLGYRDRGASVRICPAAKSNEEEMARQFNVEYRVADAAANPYLVLGSIVQAGLDGIRKDMKLKSGPPNFWKLTDSEREAAGIRRLPGSLTEALNFLEASEEARAWFGESFLALYLQFKRSEVAALEGFDPAEICKRYAEVY